MFGKSLTLNNKNVKLDVMTNEEYQSHFNRLKSSDNKKTYIL